MDDDNVRRMPGTPHLDEIAAGAKAIAAGYQKLLVEGFEPHEALYLVACLASGGPKAPPEVRR